VKAQLGGRVAIGRHVTTVQHTFARLFNAGPDFRPDGSQFDHLFDDGEHFRVGGLEAQALHTPGHTPGCMSYVVHDGDERVAFIGDTMFMPDYGTARCDFPGGDAGALYRSIRRLLALPPEARLYLCHDYPPDGRKEQAWTTVAEQRAHNVHVRDGVDEAAFVAARQARDAKLDMPALLLPSVQVNMRAGRLPPPEDNGISYLKLPINAL
jgi:glyoxylase-like metal-dependent hydrolase (beta-lactamase superfamily II)